MQALLMITLSLASAVQWGDGEEYKFPVPLVSLMTGQKNLTKPQISTS